MNWEELCARLSLEDRDLIAIDRAAFGEAAIVVINGAPRRVHPNDVYVLKDRER